MIDTISITYSIGSALVPTEDSQVDENAVYLSYDYQLVIPEDSDSPFENRWYELVDGAYQLTEDLEVDEEKDYYAYNLIEVDPDVNDNPMELGWLQVSESAEYSELSSVMSIVRKAEVVPEEIPDEEVEE